MVLLDGSATSVTNSQSTILRELTCERHEEADTRMFAHLQYCTTMLGHRKAVIYANDTDITILSMYNMSVNTNLDELWICRN